MKNRAIYIPMLVLSIIALWEYVGRHNDKTRLLASYPSLVCRYFANSYENLFQATYYTLFESIAGLLLATLFCLSTMFICFYFPKMLKFVLPVFIATQVIPLVTLAPLLILAFGIGMSSKVVMAALICFFPLFINAISGYAAIPRNIGELLFIYDAPTLFRIFRVYVPLSFPNICAGLKISATLSVIGAVVAEFNGAEFGLGKNLFLAAKKLEPEMMMSSIIITTLLGGSMYLAVWALERKFGRWYLLRGITTAQ